MRTKWSVNITRTNTRVGGTTFASGLLTNGARIVSCQIFRVGVVVAVGLTLALSTLQWSMRDCTGEALPMVTIGLLSWFIANMEAGI